MCREGGTWGRRGARPPPSQADGPKNYALQMATVKPRAWGWTGVWDDAILGLKYFTVGGTRAMFDQVLRLMPGVFSRVDRNDGYCLRFAGGIRLRCVVKGVNCF